MVGDSLREAGFTIMCFNTADGQSLETEGHHGAIDGPLSPTSKAALPPTAPLHSLFHNRDFLRFLNGARLHPNQIGTGSHAKAVFILCIPIDMMIPR